MLSKILIGIVIVVFIYLFVKILIWEDIIENKVYNAIELYNSDICKKYIEEHSCNFLCCNDCEKSNVCYRLNNEKGIIENTEECEICFTDKDVETIDYCNAHRKMSIRTIFSYRIKDLINEDVYEKIKEYI